MDGIATKSSLTFGASETRPVRLRLGDAVSDRVEAVEVDTGDPLPAGCDCVIMAEEVHYPDGGTDAGNGEGGSHSGAERVAEIIEPAVPWQNVRQVGEDIVAGEILLTAGRVLRPEDLGALLASGVTSVAVRKRPVVAVLPTGDEIVPAEADPAAGKIPEFNSAMVAGLVSQWGGRAVVMPPCADDPEAISAGIERGAERADVIAVIAGSSAGRGDFTAVALSRAGDIVVHGVAIKPGKPVMLGIAHGIPALGLPGYPVSCYIASRMFLKPLVYLCQGLATPGTVRVRAALSRRTVSQAGVDEYVRVKVGRVGDRLVATPIARGAGLVTSLVRADGVVLVPRFREGYEEGASVEVDLLRPVEDIENSVVVIGSHDVALDVLGEMLSSRHPGHSLSSAHAGSVAGLVALKRGEAHASGTHLLDPATGDYNVPYVKQIMPGKDVRLVTVAHRLQGFIVRPGNPLGIRGFADLARSGVTFVNRQRGAGTRLLLDHYLRLEGIDPASVNGYEREEFTHMAVAAAVAAGTADVGLGILAAARAMRLDFVPVCEERYELAIPGEYLDVPAVRLVLGIVESDGFKKAVESLGGYDTRETGRIRRV
jgi:putative molybdopterin biosynthesis protein